MESKQKVRKELRAERPSIYSFEIEELKSWLSENGEKPSAPRKYSNGFTKRESRHLKR